MGIKNMRSRRKSSRTKTYVTIVLIIVILIVGLLIGFKLNGLFNSQDASIQSSKSTTATMVKNLEKVDQHVFFNVGIQDIETRKNNLKIPWTRIGLPLTEKKAIIILNYDAKLGIKKPVKIKYNDKTDKKNVEITVPKFDVIGVELDKKNPYQLYDDSGNVLSASTKNVDTGQLVSQALSSSKQRHYLKTYNAMIQDSAKDYYTTFFKSFDEGIKVRVAFE